jgi:hypothetical protein
MADKIVFSTNVPETLALKYARGKSVASQFEDGGNQTMFTTTDGRVMFLSEYAAGKIDALGLAPGEPFTICKREVRANGKPAHVEWQVERPNAQQPASSAPAVAPTQNVPSGSSSPQHNRPVPVPMDRAIALYLLTAGRATRQAETILGAEGGSVRFDSRDIAALATSMFIHAGREGWLAAITPETAQQSVAEQKIAGLQAAAKPAAPSTPAEPEIPEVWTTRGEMKQVFLRLRELIGDVRYFQELGLSNVSDPSQFRTGAEAKAVYARLVSIVKHEEAA